MGETAGAAFDLFQSTLSVRRATRLGNTVSVDGVISIHALRKESDNTAGGKATQALISIHALRKESDRGQGIFGADDQISIHALRKESDHAP